MSDGGTLHRKQPLFGAIPEKLMHDHSVTDGAKLLYAHMHWRYGKNKRNFEGLKKMADFMDVSETCIRKRIAELEHTDWVIVIYRGRDPKSGKYQTPFYHVFESQKLCQTFRMRYAPQDGEYINPKSADEQKRKARKGVGGKVANLAVGQNLPNSSSDGTRPTQVETALPNSNSSGLPNSSWGYPLPVYPLPEVQDKDSVPNGTETGQDDIPDLEALYQRLGMKCIPDSATPAAAQNGTPPQLLEQPQAVASANGAKIPRRKAPPQLRPPADGPDESLIAWRDAVTSVWKFTGARAWGMVHMLRGTAKKTRYAPYNLEQPLTAVQQILDWYEWFCENKSDDPKYLVAVPETIQSSFGEWQMEQAQTKKIIHERQASDEPAELPAWMQAQATVPPLIVKGATA